jgi:hypothetical protein
MKLGKFAALAALVLVAPVGAASAAPIGNLGSAPAVENGVVQVHGRHSTCELGVAGWHRSPRRGVRIACRPQRPRGNFWIWRSEGPRHGWYHRHERRWHR